MQGRGLLNSVFVGKEVLRNIFFNFSGLPSWSFQVRTLYQLLSSTMGQCSVTDLLSESCVSVLNLSNFKSSLEREEGRDSVELKSVSCESIVQCICNVDTSVRSVLFDEEGKR